MNGSWAIFELTLAEARRRRILLAALVCGVSFVVLFGIGFHFVAREVHIHSALILGKQRLVLTSFVLVGLYAANFLTIMTAILMPVDTLSGEIASGVIQTIASKPIRRSTIVLGKWLAHVCVLAGYLVVVAGGVLLVARVLGRVTPPGLEYGLPLMLLEGLVLVTLSLAGGSRLSTITNGIVVLGLYGLAFVGSWTEQIGAATDNQAARYVGTVASLLEPSESMWQLASWHMQPSVYRDLHLTPFSPISVPNGAMVGWAVGYMLVILVLAVRGLSKRPL